MRHTGQLEGRRECVIRDAPRREENARKYVIRGNLRGEENAS